MRVRAGDVQASLRRFGAATATATSEGGGAHAAPDGDAGSQSSRPCQSLLRLLRTFLTTHVVVSAALELDLPTRVIHASMWSSLCRRGVARTHERKRDGVLRPEKRSTVAMRGQEDARSKLAEEQTKMEAIRAQVDGERQAIALERQQLEAEKRAVGDLRRRNREELERTDAEKRVLQRERAALEEAREVTETLRAEREACDAELRRMRADNATLRQTLIDDEAVLLVRCAFPAVPFPMCGSEGVSVRECGRDGQRNPGHACEAANAPVGRRCSEVASHRRGLGVSARVLTAELRAMPLLCRRGKRRWRRRGSRRRRRRRRPTRRGGRRRRHRRTRWCSRGGWTSSARGSRDSSGRCRRRWTRAWRR